MKEKNLYDVPEMSIVMLDETDVIATSTLPAPDDEGYSQYYPDPPLLP